MTSITTRVRAGLATTVLAGTAVLVAAPAYAAVAPEAPGSVQAATLSKAQIEHYEVTEKDWTPAPGLSAQTKAQIERLERAAQEQESGTSTGTPGSSSSDDDSSVPVTLLLVASGAAVAGAAGLTVYRIRHHGPMSPATA